MAGTWSSMLSMTQGTLGHISVVVRNKLYVIGGRCVQKSLEVFDSFSNQFTDLKQSLQNMGVNIRVFQYTCNVSEAVAVGNNILIFRYYSNVAIVFDLDECKWSNISFPHTISWYHGLKVPKLSI